MVAFAIGFVIDLLSSLELVAGLPSFITNTPRDAWVDWWMRAPGWIAGLVQFLCALCGGVLAVLIQRIV